MKVGKGVLCLTVMFNLSWRLTITYIGIIFMPIKKTPMCIPGILM